MPGREAHGSRRIVGSMVAAALTERPRFLVARRGLLWLVVGVETLALAVMMTVLAAGVLGIDYRRR